MDVLHARHVLMDHGLLVPKVAHGREAAEPAVLLLRHGPQQRSPRLEETPYPLIKDFRSDELIADVKITPGLLIGHFLEELAVFLDKSALHVVCEESQGRVWRPGVSIPDPRLEHLPVHLV